MFLVCGIAGGLSYAEDDYGDFKRFNGLATAAKISFFDISVTGSPPGSVSLPPDIGLDLFGTETLACNKNLIYCLPDLHMYDISADV